MKYRKIVVLTGAGISQESGLNTFRGADGLWEGHRVEDVCTPEAYDKNPALVYEFYNLRRRGLLNDEVKPNAAHLALAEFERKFDGEFLIVTQNVDNLHERAGSKNVLHMHGELLKARGLGNGIVVDWQNDLDAESRSEEVGNQPLRPHIVWFGEMPLYMDKIESALKECDLFISIGTSGLVYPAAGFVGWVSDMTDTVELNLDDTATSPSFKESIKGKATEVVGEFFKKITPS